MLRRPLPSHPEKIGVPGIVVEVDETKMAKRKFNKGHPVGDKSWLLVAKKDEEGRK